MSDIPRFSPNEEAEMQLQWNIENGSDVWGFTCPRCGEDTNSESCYDVDIERDPSSVTEPAYCDIECYISALIEDLNDYRRNDS